MEAGLREVAGQRLPALSLLALLCLLEIAIEHGGSRILLVLGPLPIAVSLATAAALRIPALHRRAGELAAACLIVLAVAAACSAAAAGSLARTPLDLAVLALVGAAVFPLGARTQAAIAAALLTVALLALRFVPGPASAQGTESVVAIVSLMTALGASTFVAAATRAHVDESLRLSGDAVRRSTALARRVEAADRELERRGLALERALEEAEKANVAKARFVGGMSHELRTPLNAILGFARMLLDDAGGPLQPKQRDYLGEIVVAAGHLLRKVEGVLLHARVEGDGDPLQRCDIPIDLLAAAAVRHAALDAAGKGITLHSPAPTGIHVTGDRTRLLQVFLNLLSNAIRFTPEGGHVGIELADGGDRVSLVVWDHGIGVAAADRDRIFLPFEQVAGATRTAEKGTGLGLANCKRLIEVHGGSISLDSATGRGSRFVVSLPKRPDIADGFGADAK
ncbi:MAG: hypothetical protein QOD06_350 [Candidatus Binatota bacterium]|nr:hypothetical protein [Candidatus Binatota bacterium]